MARVIVQAAADYRRLGGGALSVVPAAHFIDILPAGDYSLKIPTYMKKMQKPVTAAIYARVSTLDQKHDMQLSELRAYADRMGFKVIEYTEKMSSVKRRPVFDELMADAQLRKFDAVIVWKLDRFARSMKQFVDSVMQLDQAGIIGSVYQLLPQAFSLGDGVPVYNPVPTTAVTYITSTGLCSPNGRHYAVEGLSGRTQAGSSRADVWHFGGFLALMINVVGMTLARGIEYQREGSVCSGVAIAVLRGVSTSVSI